MKDALSTPELESELWLKCKKRLEERLQELRAKNDNMLSHEETAYLRGRIAEIHWVLDTPDQKPKIVGDLASGAKY